MHHKNNKFSIEEDSSIIEKNSDVTTTSVVNRMKVLGDEEQHQRVLLKHLQISSALSHEDLNIKYNSNDTVAPRLTHPSYTFLDY